MNHNAPIQGASPRWTFVVTANFTAEPILDTLDFWTTLVGLAPAAIEFSAYNQVHQALRDPGSPLAARTPGANFLAIRTEEWARHQHDDEIETSLRDAVDELIAALKDFAPRASRPTLLALAPPSDETRRNPALARVIAELDASIEATARMLRGLEVVTATDIERLYPVTLVDDPEARRVGHVPFTSEYWVALGTTLVRRARPFLQPPAKLVVVDADNTLWGGVVGEAGPAHVDVTGPWRALHTFLHDRKQRGMLLAIVSKNDPEDVLAVLQRPDMLLCPSDFVSIKASWQPKSAHVRELAAELGLGPSSFVFLDDNPTECAEVGAACPDVTVLQLPADPSELPAFVDHLWALDLPPATAADANRTEQYRQQSERRLLRGASGSFREFIERLDLHVAVAAVTEAQIDRAAQLTQRTNQFNATGVRRTAAELGSLLASGARHAVMVRVRDRFGDYGDVGLCVYELQDTPRGTELVLDNFLLSCRVLGKGVEHRLIAALGDLAAEAGAARVVIPFRRTPRNEPAERFLQAVGAAYFEDEAYRFPTDVARAIVFAPPDVEDEPIADEKADEKTPTAATGRDTTTDFAEIVSHLRTVSAIAARIDERARSLRPALATGFVDARTPVEATLAAIWARVLRVDRVGVEDNFFDLGGDSILSVQIIAQAAQHGLRFTLRDQFERPTIAELAPVVTQADAAPARASQEPVSGPVPLTAIQHWFFDKALPDPAHWNMELFLEARQRLEPELLEAALAAIVRHHDALRMRFTPIDGVWHQENAATDDHRLLVRCDLSSMTADEQAEATHREAQRAHASLQLADGPLLRAVWFDNGAGRPSRLLLVIHHLVVDGITWRVLIEDLQAAYRALVDGRDVSLPPKTTSFAEWARHVVSYANSAEPARELEHWRHAGDAVSPLPLDEPAGIGRDTEDTVRVTLASLDAAETRVLLQDVPKAYQTQINEVLLTALLLTCHEWTGADTLRIDLEGHGRETIGGPLDISRTAGWFTSIFPVVLTLARADDPADALKAVKERLRTIPNRGIGYGLLRYLSRDPQVQAALAAQPAADLMFNYLGQFDQILPADGLFRFADDGRSGALLHGPRGRRSHAIEIIGWVRDDRLTLEWTTSRAVFPGDTIPRLADRFTHHLRRLIDHCTSSTAGGFTPSDFPLANLGQADLDRVLALLARST